MTCLLKRVILFFIFPMVFGCSPIAPKFGTTADNMQQVLSQGSAVDRAMAKQEKLAKIPDPVQSALLPNRNFQIPDRYSVEQSRFNISVKEVPAKSFFTGLVKGSPYSVIVDPKVSGTITLDLKNVTIEQVLQAVRDVYGYDYLATAYGFEIIPAGIKTEIFTINYLNVSRTGETETSVSGGSPTTVSNSQTTSTSSSTSQSSTNPKSSSVKTSSASNIWSQLKETLLSLVGGDKEGRSVVVEPQAGMVVVRAFPSELKKVGEYLNTLQNTMNRQVILEAKILEVRLNDGFQSGIKWELLTNLLQGNDTSASNFTNNVFLLKLSAGSAFSAAIKLLSSQGNVQVLSSPRVSTVNNQKAVIKVGTDEYFVTGLSTTNSNATGVSDITQNVNLTPFFSGIALDVTPQIDNRGNVILHIHPSISEVTQQEKNVTIGLQEVSLPVAQSTIRESDSIVRAQSGQVVVIGGLMQNNTKEGVNGTPFLGDLPFLGTIFRNTEQTALKSELVILLRPFVVNSGTWYKELDKVSDRYHQIDRGFHLGNKPEIFGNLGERRPGWARP